VLSANAQPEPAIPEKENILVRTRLHDRRAFDFDGCRLVAGALAIVVIEGTR
jgi:hypothetical protein